MNRPLLVVALLSVPRPVTSTRWTAARRWGRRRGADSVPSARAGHRQAAAAWPRAASSKPAAATTARQLPGDVGSRLPGRLPGRLRGEPAACGAADVYTADSVICRAAASTPGLISPARRRRRRVASSPGRPAYRGSARNGVESHDYGQYPKSYVLFPGGGQAAAAVPPPAQYAAPPPAEYPPPPAYAQPAPAGTRRRPCERSKPAAASTPASSAARSAAVTWSTARPAAAARRRPLGHRRLHRRLTHLPGRDPHRPDHRRRRHRRRDPRSRPPRLPRQHPQQHPLQRLRQVPEELPPVAALRLTVATRELTVATVTDCAPERSRPARRGCRAPAAAVVEASDARDRLRAPQPDEFRAEATIADSRWHGASASAASSLYRTRGAGARSGAGRPPAPGRPRMGHDRRARTRRAAIRSC